VGQERQPGERVGRDAAGRRHFEIAAAGAVARNPQGPDKPYDPAEPLEKKRVHRGGSFLFPDSEALPVIFDLAKKEGLVLGGSSGINVAGAIRLARDLGPGHTIVTILADSGTRYQSKLFNRAFLESKGLPAPEWL